MPKVTGTRSLLERGPVYTASRAVTRGKFVLLSTKKDAGSIIF